MSRLGKKPIAVPTGVTVTVTDGTVAVKGPKGTLSRSFKRDISFSLEGDTVVLTPERETVATRALWGTYASHLKNMVEGVTQGYVKKLTIEGVGYKWDLKGKDVVLALGFSHPVVVLVPEGITVLVEKGTMTVSGYDKEAVGTFAARIKALKPVEPYKGKGIRYEGERVRRKQGKKSAK
ncbi:MAG TPA: 50S ribosomal protein L6 [Candidatus Vogelbacteria bacterium]|uniref:Large ribosomal subunit protein uL6 n=1 Tax=Candidatus Vogelbacteria bacterium RIFOXYD1_FULL_51_18 TaxID=1802440 RepID=A0A1G2QHU4_9BACT|nr:MAG: 50S ribosomal protein L6 [Parcubacteria group bacterium GW2011_GWC1_51_35]KKW24485.1 MAG: 50S ribosomal protein L6 [Parcubacteria group bacterium GW2011_GWF2_52_12]KKW28003.1 MAG: 50S ribosomal protein L6 [Parcubacteria group bacterium GW2011_GWF1_52_5]OHA60027.1 MAG: 50S ribosomal protein L6 [Candidatus Vogelbacteria bacterium RIFOXYD1_FULL_51_18]HBB65623.1 50S ribosomal protein L6 [Candidatus Vogelbacteria bacterium]